MADYYQLSSLWSMQSCSRISAACLMVLPGTWSGLVWYYYMDCHVEAAMDRHVEPLLDEKNLWKGICSLNSPNKVKKLMWRACWNFMLTKCDVPIWLIAWCVWVCDKSHIGYLLGRSGFYKQLQGVSIVINHFEV